VLRKIIEIDQDKCDACQECIKACPEGAIQMVKGKANLVKDFYCDGLGACIGKCPQGAITVIEKEAVAYNEKATMFNIIKQGDSAIQQHLDHLREHKEYDLLKEAEEVLDEHKNNGSTLNVIEKHKVGGACPGSRNMEFEKKNNEITDVDNLKSTLTHWPIQMHLISPHAPQYHKSNLLLAADCVSYSVGNFHQDYLREKTLTIACPKLDQNQQIYLDKLVALIDESEIQSISVMVMQVPCCSGLVNLTQAALQKSKKSVPVTLTIVGIRGKILSEQQVN
jgi:Pyruvate/2-oxoacid:ferredoxin oxidoreductase delta subunit